MITEFLWATESPGPEWQLVETYLNLDRTNALWKRELPAQDEQPEREVE